MKDDQRREKEIPAKSEWSVYGELRHLVLCGIEKRWSFHRRGMQETQCHLNYSSLNSVYPHSLAFSFNTHLHHSHHQFPSLAILRESPFKLLFYFFIIIHMCIHCLGHFSPLPPPPPLPPTQPPPSPPHPLNTQQKLFCPYL
jgi:hypothetical protein